MTIPSTPILDTVDVYGRVTRWLHWSIALLLAWQFLGMGLKLIFGRQPFLAPLVGSHQPVGTVLFVLIVLRVIWAVVNRRNRPRHGNGLLGIAAVTGHGLLYLAMVMVPCVALLRAYGSERAFAPFGFEIFPARATEIGWMVDLGGLLHGELGWVLGALILGHVVMVGIHETMWRDGTLARMTRAGS
ncbi:cytochrome b/b6 domain-containing protein [Paracoccus sp. MBLB3053]|uniref:Cytochrome b/b6 domain-containing protein n=1 Tax=Paracoccus aurantius TaxID=3073814 RepID=A0ABU2HUV8_9RHOB|nr:cytochrome b/b6 domain-containing protein [Paracoccus sp. MBLB3053]MDS9468843.1 cytochrome b/b6 domain-containing protein [Paracoccus sp. MBLB3053]